MPLVKKHPVQKNPATRQAWRNRAVLSVSFAVGASYIGIGMVIPVRVLYAQSRGASLEIIGAMASAYLLSNVLFQYPAGWLADHWGRQRTLIVSLAVQGLLSLLYLFIANPLLFVALRFVEGMAAAGLLPAAQSLLMDAVPSEQRGEAFGIFNAFFNSGFLLGPAIGGFLAVGGYSGAFIGAVIFRIVALLIVSFTIVQTKTSSTQQPRQRETFQALFRWPLVGAYILSLGDYFYLGFDQTLFPIWMKNNLGGSVALIGLAYALWAIPTTLLSPFAGGLADRRRRSSLILIFGLAQIPIYIAYGLANSAWIVAILFGIHGIVYSFVQPAVDAHVASAVNSSMRAQAQSMYTTVGLIGAFIGANGLPALYSINFRLPLFVMAGSFACCVLVGVLIIRRTESQNSKPSPLPKQ